MVNLYSHVFYSFFFSYSLSRFGWNRFGIPAYMHKYPHMLDWINTRANGAKHGMQVSWVRRRPGETGLELLTVGLHTYSADDRYKVEFQYPNNWKLKIESVIREDEGTYECQISTYPPRVIQKNIFVIGEYGDFWDGGYIKHNTDTAILGEEFTSSGRKFLFALSLFLCMKKVAGKVP